VAVALLVWLDHRTAAAILFAVMAVVTVASALSPSLADLLGRVEHGIQRVAGRVLSFALMGLVCALVFTPLWLVLRLLGHDPLERGQTAGDASFWRPHPELAGRPLYRRPFAYDRVIRPRASRALHVTAALGVVVLLVGIDLSLGAAIDRLEGGPAPQSPTALTGAEPPAGRGQPWRLLIPEVTNALQSKSYDPFLSFRVLAFDGTYVNVKNGIRESYEPPAALSRDAVTVYFFGGSAMFGAFQRDQHTIPSEFARLAEADGIPVRVVNYGQPAYVNWQETLLLESLVTGRSKPDLAVFYDGFNELLTEFAIGDHRDPTHLQARVMQERLASDAGVEDNSFFKRAWKTWKETSAVYRAGTAIGVVPEPAQDEAPLLSPFVGDQKDHPGARAAHAMSIYRRGVDLARRVSESYGFRSAFFWQPSVYSRRLVSDEESLQSAAGYDAEAWQTATRVARSRLAPPVVDLSRALDGIREPVMYDVVHTNEYGARTMGAAMFGRLEPELRRLAEAKRR
jgi:hypothetical protein